MIRYYLDSLISEAKLEMEAAKLGHYDVEYFIPLPKVEHKKITIALLDPNICNSEFGFYKEEIIRMRASLSMPERFSKNGCVFNC